MHTLNYTVNVHGLHGEDFMNYMGTLPDSQAMVKTV